MEHLTMNTRFRTLLLSCHWLLLMWLGITSPRATADDSRQEARRPNVLFVFSDMQRAYSMGCYGDSNARTPNLDALAKQGVRFDAAIANTPVCCPYRACLMSGQYAHHNGVVSNQVEFRPTVKCLAETFREAGYETGYSGKWHINSPADASEELRYGFPLSDEEFGFYRTDRKSANVTDVALRFIDEKSKGPAPWLLVVSWILPHGPYRAPDGYREHFADITIPPNVPEGLPAEFARQNLPDYYGMIESLDDEFQRMLLALQNAGVADDTIVVFTSDHGDMIGCQGLKAKRWPHDQSARIPLLIRYPRTIHSGSVINAPFGATDVYPTLAGLAGIPSPEGLDGEDFSPLLRGEVSQPPRDYVYLEMPYAYVPWPGWRAIRTRQYMYARTKEKPWLLFDLINDPWEMNNLVDDPASQSLVQQMDSRLTAVMRASGDSWSYRASTGDLKNWLPGGSKQRSQSALGADWPGKLFSGNAPMKQRKAGEKKKEQQKSSAAR
jgi:arylsulfatase A-like enzyme